MNSLVYTVFGIAVLLAIVLAVTAISGSFFMSLAALIIILEGHVIGTVIEDVMENPPEE